MKCKDQLVLEQIYTSKILNEDNLLNPDDLIDFLMMISADMDRELTNDEKAIFKKWVGRDIKRKVAAEVTPFEPYTKEMGGPSWYNTVKDGKIYLRPSRSMEAADYAVYTLGNIVRGALLYYKMIDAKERTKVLKITLQDAYKRYKKAYADKPKENVDYKVVMKFTDGFKIVELLSRLGYSYQGKSASNCVSPEMCKQGNLEIYGLWNPNNKAKGTIALELNTNKILEVAVFSTKYAPYLFEFIKANNLVPVVGSFVGEDETFGDFPAYAEYLTSKGIQPPDTTAV